MKLWNDFLNLFYPPLCLLCQNSLVEGEQHICTLCLYSLPRYRMIDESRIFSLFLGKSEISNLAVAFVFEKEGAVQRLIHDLKYYGNKELAAYLARLSFLDYLSRGESICNAEVLLPVPLHSKREKERGYNQSEWIAKGISSVLHIPIDTTSLRRCVRTETQTKRKVFDRWRNMEDVFELVAEDNLRGKRILLVDDVLTTGATFNACARALQTIPDITLSAFALSMV